MAVKFPFRPRGAPAKEDTTPKKGFRRYLFELRDSNVEFWTAGHAVLKLATLGCLVSALDHFEAMVPHPILILVLSMEVAIYIFFIFLNTLAINRYIAFIFWPMTDIFNSLFSCVFLGGSIYFALKARRLLPKPYLTAMILMGVAAVACFLDIFLQFRHFRGLRIREVLTVASMTFSSWHKSLNHISLSLD
ncbi:CKLF-like MARVEL transmembrane domain-containing protein 2A [Apodemus sylvaticus]|uniref:CKLF-like MARVEL transmembrane domain-containing protein 2A n=1 Tax=Apodemus sylvaticus TaxID=10129 RepID=UPI002244BBE8|nr:CKLF-like MARVEL transmembrane domain-containing protein 2A [Apodemus sylvaticus]